MKKNASQNPNPALKDLEVLVGDWNMELSNASFLPSPSDIMTGYVSFDWLEGEPFLLCTWATHQQWAHQILFG
jgi:hypothetical protein